MSKHVARALTDLGAVAISAGGNVEALEHVMIMIGGTFVGTYSVEGSVDGTTFAAMSDIHGNSLAGLTAPTTRQLPVGLNAVRVNCTAYTSGTIESDVGGLDADLRG